MKRNVFLTALLIIAFIVSYFASQILYSFNPNWSDYLPDDAYLWELSWLGLRILPVALVALIISKKKILVDLGLNANFIRAFLYALLFTAPLFIGFGILGKLNHEVRLVRIVSNCIVPGFYEEVLIRSFMVGWLFKRLKWGFIPASFLGAVFFGAWHLYQGHDLLSSLFTFLITAAGSVWFGWLFLEWRMNAWINISLHALMNFSWLLFSVEGGAAGNVLSNVFRLATVVFSIVITIQMQSRKNGFVVNRKTLWVNRTSTSNR